MMAVMAMDVALKSKKHRVVQSSKEKPEGVENNMLYYLIVILHIII